MRTIELTEYETTPANLIEEELDQVQRTGLIEVSRRLGGGYELRPGSVVGTLVFPRLRLLIRPKMGVRNLFFILSYAAGLTRWREERFPYAEDDDLFRAVAWLFEAEVARAARTGLTRDYIDREETLATLRGRLDLGRQLRIRQARRWPIECRYQDFTEDTALNRVIKAACRRLLQVPGVDSELIRDLRRHLRLFSEVAPVEYASTAVPDLQFNRLNESWEPSGRLASLILRHDSVRDQSGSAAGLSFTVDLNRAFERFIEAVVSEESRRAGYTVERQARRKLTSSVRMQPDLVLRQAGLDLAVADAKYKELAPADWPHADLYQLLAYCDALQLKRGLLIYAGKRKPQKEVVSGNGVELDLIGVDLTGDHRGVLARARAAAAALIEQAESGLSARMVSAP